MGDEALAGKPPRESHCEVGGWRFEASHGDAMSSQARAVLAHEKLQLNARVPLPEMVFAQSGLTAAHPSQNVLLRFDAVAALKLWAASHIGARWDHTNFDFTYCSNYHGSVERYKEKNDSTATVEIEAVPTTESLPLAKLMQHVEILYYDRVVLFEDDVRDLGEIYLEVKTRVMGFGFLVLCRYYCRIDGKSVRLMDTRYYHEFGQAFIWRDHEVRETELHKLHHGDGHPVAQPDYSADTIYATLRPNGTITEKIFFTS